jgi:hypothetical protein
MWLDVRGTQKEKDAKHAKVCVWSPCLFSLKCVFVLIVVVQVLPLRIPVSPQESSDLRKELQAASERVKELASLVEAANAENTTLHAVSSHHPRRCLSPTTTHVWVVTKDLLTSPFPLPFFVQRVEALTADLARLEATTTAALQRAIADRDVVASDKASLSAELGKAVTEAKRIGLEHDRIVNERDRIAGELASRTEELAGTIVAADALRAQVAGLELQVASAAASLAKCQGDLDKAGVAQRKLKEEKDKVVSGLAHAQQEREQAIVKVAQTQADAERAASEREQLAKDLEECKVGGGG